MTSSAELLSLVRAALDELDDRAFEVTIRRAARIASLLGQSPAACLGFSP
jgi:hypothetical protein